MSAAFLAAHAEKADAQIMYTDVIPDDTIQNSFFNLDLNNDGIADFELKHKSSADSFYNTYSSGGWNIDYAKNFCLGLNQMEDINSFWGYYIVPAALAVGDTINQNQIFGIEPILKFHSFFYPGGLSYNINNVVGIDKYIGLKVVKNSQTYYGWARLDVNSYDIVLKSYAINAVPDSAIIVGDTGATCNIIPPVISPNVSEIICSNDSITLNLFNSNGFNIQWMKDGQWIIGETDSTISINESGNYEVLVTDSNCAVYFNAINIDTVIFSLNETHVNDGCNDSIGYIDVMVLGNSPSYNYLWNNGQTTQDLSNISSGVYQLTVTSSICSVADSLTVSIGNSLAPVLTETHTDNTCNNNGSINLNVTGGSLPYNYSWSNFFTTQDLNNLSSGTYSVSVYDDNNCSNTLSITIFNYSLIIFETHSDTACNNNGHIDLTVTGGTPVYNYLWNTGASQQDLINVSAGNYSVTVTDFNGCTNEISIPIISFVLPVPSVSQNGNILSSSAAFISYQWFLNTQQISGATNQQYSPTQNGSYQVQVTDANGCTGISNPLYFYFTSVNNVELNELNFSITDKKITFQLNNPLIGDEIIFYNELGEQVAAIKIENKNPVIDLSLAPTGIYFYHIRSKQKYYSGKFYIE